MSSSQPQISSSPINSDVNLNFDDEITRRVQEMTERFKKKMSTPKAGPSNPLDPSFMLSPGFIEPMETHPKRKSDSLYR